MTKRDRELIDRLLQDDDSAWEQVLTQTAVCILRKKGYIEWLKKEGHEYWEVLSELSILLHKDDHRLLRGVTESFNAYLGKCVHSAVKTVLDPLYRRGGGKELPEDLRPGGGSDDDDEKSLGTIDEFVGESSNDLGRSEFHKSAVDSLADKDDTYERKRHNQVIRSAFSRFCQEKPRAAYALLMNVRLHMTYAEIGRLMGEKGNTVQKWIYDSRNWWRAMVPPEEN